MERASYWDFKNTKNMKKGEWEHLLLSLKIEKTLAMVSSKFRQLWEEDEHIFALFFPFYFIKMPNDQNSLIPFL